MELTVIQICIITVSTSLLSQDIPYDLIRVSCIRTDTWKQTQKLYFISLNKRKPKSFADTIWTRWIQGLGLESPHYDSGSTLCSPTWLDRELKTTRLASKLWKLDWLLVTRKLASQLQPWHNIPKHTFLPSNPSVPGTPCGPRGPANPRIPFSPFSPCMPSKPCDKWRIKQAPQSLYQANYRRPHLSWISPTSFHAPVSLHKKNTSII